MSSKILPNGWSELSLGDAARYINGRAFKPKEWSRKGLPIIRIQNLNDREKEFNYFDGECDQKHYVENGDILISWSASLGVYVWDRGPAVLNQHIFKVLPNESLLDRRYYVYAVQTILDEMKSRVHGATMRHIVKGDFQSLKIPVPPLPTQRSMAEILGRGERLQRIRQEANQLTSRIIQSVFLKMFGDKEPQNRIGDVATFVSSGSTPLGGEKTYLDSGIVFVRSQNVLMNELDLTEVAHISKETHQKMRRTWVKDGDVLLNITGASLGRTVVYRGQDDSANVNQHVCIIRHDKNKAIPEYVSFYLSTTREQKQIWTIQAGASRQALNFEQVRSLDLYLPGIDQQKKFAEFMEGIRTVKERQKQSTSEIDELFQSLMHKAFRGDLIV